MTGGQEADPAERFYSELIHGVDMGKVQIFWLDFVVTEERMLRERSRFLMSLGHQVKRGERRISPETSAEFRGFCTAIHALFKWWQEGAAKLDWSQGVSVLSTYAQQQARTAFPWDERLQNAFGLGFRCAVEVNKEDVASLMRALVVVNSDFGLHTAIQEAKRAKWKTIAIHPKHAPFTADADLALPVDNIMDVHQVAAAVKRASTSMPRTSFYVHPVYGYHSERTELSRAVASLHNVKMVAPPPETVRAWGDKREARIMAQKLGVPVIPGLNNEERWASSSLLREAWMTHSVLRNAKAAMVKRPDGGGGRGNRVVETEADLDRAIVELGGDVIVEMLLTGRHKQYECQIVVTEDGPLYLPMRDCSEQRRFQKRGREIGFQHAAITEELSVSGATHLARGLETVRQQQEKIGQKLFEQGYRGPATAEFLCNVDTGETYFCEINTRIQVEHRTSGYTAGVDILTLQRLVASSASDVDSYLDDLLEKARIPFDRSWTQQERLNLLQRNAPPVCVQVRLYAQEMRFEAGEAIESPVDGVTVEKVFDNHVDTYLKPGCVVDSRYVDGMIGIAYGSGTNIVEATTNVRNALSNFEATPVPTTRDVSLLWLDALRHRRYCDVHTGSYESFLSSLALSKATESRD